MMKYAIFLLLSICQDTCNLLILLKRCSFTGPFSVCPVLWAKRLEGVRGESIMTILAVVTAGNRINS